MRRVVDAARGALAAVTSRAPSAATQSKGALQHVVSSVPQRLAQAGVAATGKLADAAQGAKSSVTSTLTGDTAQQLLKQAKDVGTEYVIPGVKTAVLSQIPSPTRIWWRFVSGAALVALAAGIGYSAPGAVAKYLTNPHIAPISHSTVRNSSRSSQPAGGAGSGSGSNNGGNGGN